MNRSIYFFILLIFSVYTLSAQKAAHRIPIAFYNVENLFDCNDDANDDAECARRFGTKPQHSKA